MKKDDIGTVDNDVSDITPITETEYKSVIEPWGQGKDPWQISQSTKIPVKVIFRTLKRWQKIKYRE